MKNMQPGLWTSVLAILFAASFLLFLPGCQSPLDSQDNAPGIGSGRGTLSLTIGRQDMERTVMPTWPEDFVGFKLEFFACPDTDNEDFYEIWGGDSNTGRVELNAGSWDLHVTAFLAGTIGGGLSREAAWGYLPMIDVPSGWGVVGNIELRPIARENSHGTFGWEIGYPENIVYAHVEIWRVDLYGVPEDYYYYSRGLPVTNAGGTLDGSHDLPAGRYFVVFMLTNNQGKSAQLSASLHVYQHLKSIFDEEFRPEHFPVSLLDLILDAWNGTGWNLVDEGITAGHFSFLGIKGVNDDNFTGLVEQFNLLTTVATVPSDEDELKALVDAALIGMAIADGHFADTHFEGKHYAEEALALLVQNGTEIEFDWTDNSATVSIGVFQVVATFKLDQ